MIEISSAVQSRGAVFKTSRNTGPYAVRSSSFEDEVDMAVVVFDFFLLAPLLYDNFVPDVVICTQRQVCRKQVVQIVKFVEPHLNNLPLSLFLSQLRNSIESQAYSLFLNLRRSPSYSVEL
jgi:hypothetical protein